MSHASPRALTRRTFLTAAGGTIAGLATVLAGLRPPWTRPSREGRGHGMLHENTSSRAAGGGAEFNLLDFVEEENRASGNHTSAFQRLAGAVSAAGGGRVVIPPGTYVVGQQDFAGASGLGYSFRPAAVFRVAGLAYPLEVEGSGARIVWAEGLRFGSFDPATGQPYHTPIPEPDLFVDHDYRADIGRMLEFHDCPRGVTVRGVELDGNLAALVIGGRWGDKGIQCTGIGIACHNSRLVVEHVHGHHQPLDGILVQNYQTDEREVPIPVRLVESRFNFNARQGLSWVGGLGLEAIGCEFSYTGQGGLFSAPGAGVDVEAEGGAICRHGRFVGCEMLATRGPAFVADAGDSAELELIDTTLWASAEHYAAWPNQPAIRFERCTLFGPVTNLFGSADPALATRFVGCTFADRHHPEYGGSWFTGELIVSGNGAENALFEDCTVQVEEMRAFHLANEERREILRRCRIHLRCDNRPPGDHVAFLRGTRLEEVEWLGEYRRPPSPPHYISVDAVEVRGRVVIAGRGVAWSSPGGPRGRIPLSTLHGGPPAAG